jgi:hypothetical protein
MAALDTAPDMDAAARDALNAAQARHLAPARHLAQVRLARHLEKASAQRAAYQRGPPGPQTPAQTPSGALSPADSGRVNAVVRRT